MNIKQLKAHCQSFPGALETVHSAPSNILVYSVEGKTFAYFKTSEPEQWRFSVRVSSEQFLELTDMPGVKPARYMGRFHWITVVKVQAFPQPYLMELVEASYRRALASLSKKKQLEITLKRKPARKVRPVLLTGGNPQIAKADGDAPVQAYIAAMPDWRADIGRRLDTLITETVPDVCKAVKWNSPFYGVVGQGWFVSFHTFTNYVKVTFFQGVSLEPAPTGGKSEAARWINVGQDDFDEVQMTKWIRQATALPGWGKS